VKEALNKILIEDSITVIYYCICNPLLNDYLHKAADKASKEKSSYFLKSFSECDWLKNYIEYAVKIAAKEDPKYYLENWSSIFPDSITTALFSLKVALHER